MAALLLASIVPPAVARENVANDAKIEPVLLRAISANPNGQYDVIVTRELARDRNDRKAAKEDVTREIRDKGGRVKDDLAIIDGQSATISGRAVLALSKNKNVHSISTDHKVVPLQIVPTPTPPPDGSTTTDTTTTDTSTTDTTTSSTDTTTSTIDTTTTDTTTSTTDTTTTDTTTSTTDTTTSTTHTTTTDTTTSTEPTPTASTTEPTPTATTSTTTSTEPTPTTTTSTTEPTPTATTSTTTIEPTPTATTSTTEPTATTSTIEPTATTSTTEPTPTATTSTTTIEPTPTATASTTTTTGGLQSLGTTLVNAPQVWSTYGNQGQGIGVAVLDSGIAASPDLTNATFGVNVVSDITGLYDGGGHGSHVAGIIAGNGSLSAGAYKGIAPQASVISVKVISDDGKASYSSVIKGLQWVINNRGVHNIKVANLSLGSTVTESYINDPLIAAVEMAWFAGITVVVSAGNGGSAAGTITVPANDPYAISVGALDPNETLDPIDDSVAFYSSRGPTTYDGIVKPDLIAPGRKVVSLRVANSHLDRTLVDRVVANDYFRLSGSSMSAPMVSGAVALILAQNPALTPNQVKYILKASAKPIAGADANAQGAGVVDALAAVQMAVQGIGDNKANIGKVPNHRFAKTIYPLAKGGPLKWRNLFYKNISWENITWENISWDNITWENISWENISWEKASWSNITWENISWENISWENISWDNISWDNISWNSSID